MRKYVLIADDDHALADILSARCRSMDLAVDVANDAMTAMRRIDETMPDVVILDVEMPSGNGLGICDMMSTHEALDASHVIVLTGRTDPQTIRRCYELGAYYVPKYGEIWPRLEPLLRKLTSPRSP